METLLWKLRDSAKREGYFGVDFRVSGEVCTFRKSDSHDPFSLLRNSQVRRRELQKIFAVRVPVLRDIFLHSRTESADMSAGEIECGYYRVTLQSVPASCA